ATEVEVMAITVVECRPVRGDFRCFDHQVAVVVAHESHVAQIDPAVGYSDVAGGRHSDTGSIIAIGGVVEFEICYRDVVRLDLENRAWVGQHSAYVQPGRIEYRTRSADAPDNDRVGCRAGASPTLDLVVSSRVDLDNVART